MICIQIRANAKIQGIGQNDCYPPKGRSMPADQRVSNGFWNTPRIRYPWHCCRCFVCIHNTAFLRPGPQKDSNPAEPSDKLCLARCCRNDERKIESGGEPSW